MIEVDMILVLTMVTFGLASWWMYQTKREAEAGLGRKTNERIDNQASSQSLRQS